MFMEPSESFQDVLVIENLQCYLKRIVRNIFLDATSQTIDSVQRSQILYCFENDLFAHNL